MKKRWTALLLALALCGIPALAAGSGAQAPETAQSIQRAAQEEEAGGADGAAESADEAAEAPEPPPSPAGPDSEEAPELEPDPLGEVSFANVERRMREKNLQVLSLQENVDNLENFDYDELYEDLRQSLNSINAAQYMLFQMGQGGSAASELEQSYTAVRKQFDDIKNGKLQRTNAGTIRQLKNLQDQIVMAGESMYTALVSMETQEAALERQLSALDRTLEELELRYKLGQVSALRLSEAQAGRSSLVSGLETLRMNIRVYKVQLELMLGAEQTGEIKLGSVPAVTAAQLESMDLEADLEAAKKASYELYAARQALSDSYGPMAGPGGVGNAAQTARHTYLAGRYTYENTIQNYELKFRTLYSQVRDNKQILDAAQVSLAYQESAYAVQELKYQQGNISHNALLQAADSLSEAKEAVRTASENLFASYNSYRWAAEHGILN